MLKDKKILPPPWIAYPHIERYSIGWRMGYGEDYIMKWGKWYDALSEKEQKEYQELFPAPITWLGYWEDEHEYDDFVNGKYGIQFWRKNGAYKYSLEQVQTDYARGVKQQFTMFWKPDTSADGRITKGCCSQWWMSDFYSVAHTYNCMEQFMMANKAELFGDEEVRQEILDCKDPKNIKDLGRKVRGFDETIWNKAKYSIILNGNFMKFTQNKELREFLLSTGDDILVEASPYDAIWGIRMSENDRNANNPYMWKGQNLLGFALMEVRDEIRRVWANADLCEKIEED